MEPLTMIRPTNSIPAGELTVVTVRLSKADHLAMKDAAWKAKLSLNEWCRLWLKAAVEGQLIPREPQ
jgi:hypothetical protein